MIRYFMRTMVLSLSTTMLAPMVLNGQSSSNACGLLAANQYPVGSSCSNVAFSLPTAYTPTFNPGTCNSSGADDGWGWFTATSAFTTIQFQGNQDAVLHVFTGSCAALQQVACSDAFGGTAAESVTIPTVVGQNYFIRVQRYNSSAGMTGNLCIFSSNPSSACGTTVHDSGGASGNYGNGERRIITYCPSSPGQVVRLNFSQFDVEGPGFFGPTDIMAIYNGPGTGSPLIGTYVGTNTPGIIESSHPSGCLTVVFFSDGSVTRPGWTAAVECLSAPDCFYRLTLNSQALFGGWGGSSVGYSINGGPFQNYTLGSGQSSGFVNIPVRVGDTFVIQYNAVGGGQANYSYSVGITGQGGLFLSGSPPAPGFAYAGVVDCVPIPSPPEDCLGAFTICSNQAFNGNTTNTGYVADLFTANQGCLGASERQGTWYTFSPATSGTVAFTISPSNQADDYDFAIWGPFPPGSNTATMCPPPGAPLRCSFAAPAGNTGLNFTATDLTEDPSGDKWVRFIDAVQDQVYLMYISNYSRSGLAFNMNWNPSMTATLDCTVLPMELNGLKAVPDGRQVNLEWTTLTERNSSRFVVERSSDGVTFEGIGTMAARGESEVRTDYRFVDVDPLPGVSYYRLTLLDRDGQARTTEAVPVRFGTKAPIIAPNPAGNAVQLHLTSPLPIGSLLQITDAGGRVVRTAAWNSEGTQQAVDLHGLDAGAYVLSIHLSDGSPVGQSRFVKE